VVYVQTAQDIPLDASTVDKFAEDRSKLDNKRVDAVRKALTAMTAGRGVSFEVLVHDPHEVGMSAHTMMREIISRDSGVSGILSAPSGTVGANPASTGGGGGASGGGGGGGGGSGGH
jgi:hypothetical protein